MPLYRSLLLPSMLVVLAGQQPTLLESWEARIRSAAEAESRGDFASSEQSLVEALKIAGEVKECPTLEAQTLKKLRSLYVVSRRDREEIATSKERIQALSSALTWASIEIENELTTLAQKLDAAGEYEEARRIWARVDSLGGRIEGRESVRGLALIGIARSYKLERRLNDAARYFAEGLDGGFDLGTGPRLVALEDFAEVLAELGRPEDSRRRRAEALEIRRQLRPLR